ncbi:MAG: hypothetical protein ABEK16_00560 [Candidatus Nanohalobium sp.]
MQPEVLAAAGLGVSGFTLIITLTLFHLARKRMVELESDLAELSRRQKELLEVEEAVMERHPSYEDFEKTVSNLSERLFQLVREKYELGEITTYEEMIQVLQEMDSEDEVVDDLINFFEYLEKIEYSEEELDEADRAMIRQAAFRLLRKAGSSLEGLEGRRVSG